MNLLVAGYRPQNVANYLSDMKFSDPSFFNFFFEFIFLLMVKF